VRFRGGKDAQLDAVALGNAKERGVSSEPPNWSCRGKIDRLSVYERSGIRSQGMLWREESRDYWTPCFSNRE